MSSTLPREHWHASLDPASGPYASARADLVANGLFPGPVPHRLENLRGPGVSNVLIRGFALLGASLGSRMGAASRLGRLCHVTPPFPAQGLTRARRRARLWRRCSRCCSRA